MENNQQNGKQTRSDKRHPTLSPMRCYFTLLAKLTRNRVGRINVTSNYTQHCSQVHEGVLHQKIRLAIYLDGNTLRWRNNLEISRSSYDISSLFFSSKHVYVSCPPCNDSCFYWNSCSPSFQHCDFASARPAFTKEQRRWC